MSTEYKLNNTGPEIQERIDQVMPNKEAIGQETQDRRLADEELRTDLEQHANQIVQKEQKRAESAESNLRNDIESEKQRAENSEGDLKDNINNVKKLIPEQASDQNQLADKAYVNNSVSTNSADFIGSFESLEELEQKKANNNDYAFYIQKDEIGNVKYNRYKYVDGTGWVFEYALNNTPFTEEQSAALNSGITEEDLNEIMDAVFPITLTLSVAYNGSQHTASFTVKEKGVDFIADTLVLAKTLGDGTTKTLSNTPAASGSFSSPIESNREVFKIDVTKAGRTSKSASATRYICYAGASTDGNISEGILSGFNRVSATGVGFNPQVTTGNGQYIWLVVPSYLTINKVTSAGFDVTLAAAQEITTALGTFKAYRTANPLSAAVWNLVIS